MDTRLQRNVLTLRVIFSTLAECVLPTGRSGYGHTRGLPVATVASGTLLFYVATVDGLVLGSHYFITLPVWELVCSSIER